MTDGDTVPVADTSEGHIRNAIQACILAESRLAELMIPPDPQLTELLRGADFPTHSSLGGRALWVYERGRGGYGSSPKKIAVSEYSVRASARCACV